MQDAIPPVSTGVLGNQHHIDAVLLCWQMRILILNLVEVVTDRLDDGAEWRLNRDEAYAREEGFEALANLRLFRGIKHDAHGGQLACGAFKDSTERNCTNGRAVDLAERRNDPSWAMWCIKHEIWLNGQLALVQVVALTDKCHKDCYERYEHEDNPATNSKLRKRDDDKHNASDYCTDSVQ